jgi:hypothetical protein
LQAQPLAHLVLAVVVLRVLEVVQQVEVGLHLQFLGLQLPEQKVETMQPHLQLQAEQILGMVANLHLTLA